MIRPKVLLADCGDHICNAIQQSLEGENFDVVSAPTTADALGLIVTQSFDVVIIDLRAPRSVDGPTLVTAIRQLHPKTVIVSVSSSLNVREAALAVRLEVDFIVKPINIKEVAETRMYSGCSDPNRQPRAEDVCDELLKRPLRLILASAP